MKRERERLSNLTQVRLIGCLASTILFFFVSPFLFSLYLLVLSRCVCSIFLFVGLSLPFLRSFQCLSSRTCVATKTKKTFFSTRQPKKAFFFSVCTFSSTWLRFSATVYFSLFKRCLEGLCWKKYKLCPFSKKESSSFICTSSFVSFFDSKKKTFGTIIRKALFVRSFDALLSCGMMPFSVFFYLSVQS